jgi:transposase
MKNRIVKRSIGMLNAGMSATGASQQSGCSRKTIERFRSRFRVAGIVADRPRNIRPRVTIAADGRFIVLQYLRNRTRLFKTLVSDNQRLKSSFTGYNLSVA